MLLRWVYEKSIEKMDTVTKFFSFGRKLFLIKPIMYGHLTIHLVGFGTIYNKFGITVAIKSFLPKCVQYVQDCCHGICCYGDILLL